MLATSARVSCSYARTRYLFRDATYISKKNFLPSLFAHIALKSLLTAVLNYTSFTEWTGCSASLQLLRIGWISPILRVRLLAWIHIELVEEFPSQNDLLICAELLSLQLHMGTTDLPVLCRLCCWRMSQLELNTNNKCLSFCKKMRRFDTRLPNM